MRSSTPAPARERLARLMNERRRELGRRRRKNYTWDEVATAAGVHRETLRNIRNGAGAIRDTSADGIEGALEWRPGSITRILDGGDPSPLPPPEEEAPPAKEEPTDQLERLWRDYRDDPGERGIVLRGLLRSWLEQDEQPAQRGEDEPGDKSDTA